MVGCKTQESKKKAWSFINHIFLGFDDLRDKVCEVGSEIWKGRE